MVIKYYGLRVPTRIRSETALITDPDVYADIVDTPDPIPLSIKFSFFNNEGLTLYVKVELVSAPEDYSMEPLEAGEVAHGKKIDFDAIVNRAKPENTDFMEIEESITLRVSAYTDSEYTALYDYADVTLTVHLINSEHSGWEVIKEVNFDDGTLDVVECYEENVDDLSHCNNYCQTSNSVYVSPPYSALHYAAPYYGYAVSGYFGFKLTVDTSGKSKAYLVFYMYKGSDRAYEVKIRAGDIEYYIQTVSESEWYKVVIPLPISSALEVVITEYYSFGYHDGLHPFKFYVDNIKIIGA